MSKITVWGYSIPKERLKQEQVDYIVGLPKELPSVEWIWSEMDRVWKSCGLDNRRPVEKQEIGLFYQHPVWLVNGIFTALDKVSAGHRAAIAYYLNKTKARKIADYGGGFGELAHVITQSAPDSTVDIIEPYPSQVGEERFRNNSSIKYISQLSVGAYDAIIAQDVLEHVSDPIGLAANLVNAVKEDGYVVFANCFYPVIQCHLPKTFHLRHTFRWIMKKMGLRYLGVIDGAPHAQIYQRTGQLTLAKARRFEFISKLVGPVVNMGYRGLSNIKKVVRSNENCAT
jgi:2-polyprenyl-3-methyl-5-hydroxy-6-metoxy-1,4-benzoquinol methylase